MPLTARCHSLRPDRGTGWLAFFELESRGSRSGHFLVVGPSAAKSKQDIQTALRAGQAAVRYLKEVPTHAPTTTLLEATARILDHEGARTGTALEFGVGLLEKSTLSLFCRGRVCLVNLDREPREIVEASTPQSIQVRPDQQFFFGRLPATKTDEPLSKDFLARLEHGAGGDGGLVFEFLQREAPLPLRRPRSEPRRTSEAAVAPPFDSVVEELQQSFDFESSPPTEIPQETPSPAATPSVEPVSSLPVTPITPEPLPEPESPPEPVFPVNPPEPEPEPMAPRQFEPEPQPEPELEPPSEPVSEPVLRSEPDPAPEPEPEWESPPWKPELAPQAPRPSEPIAAPSGEEALSEMPPAPPEILPASEPEPMPAVVEPAPDEVKEPEPVAAISEPVEEPQDEQVSKPPPWGDPDPDPEPEEITTPFEPVPVETLSEPAPEAIPEWFPAPEAEAGIEPVGPAPETLAASLLSAEAAEEDAGPSVPGSAENESSRPDVPLRVVNADDPPSSRVVPLATLAKDRSPAAAPPAYAPEETRGLGFWMGVVAACLGLGLVITYLAVWRPAIGDLFSRDPSGLEAVSPGLDDSGHQLGTGFLDETVCEIVWSERLPKPVSSSPLVLGDHVVFGCRDGLVYCLNRKDGSRRWAYAANDGFGSSPSLAGDLIVIGGYDGQIYALDTATGSERWTVTTGGKIVASPVADDEKAYVGSFDHLLYAVNLADGSVAWKRDLGAVQWSSPVRHGNLVISAGLDGGITAVRATDGRVVWRAKTEGAIYSSPTIAEGKVVVGSADGHLHAFAVEDGAPVWKLDAEGEVNGSPAYADGRLVVGTDRGEVMSVDIEDGTAQWKVVTGGEVKSRPAFWGPAVWVTGYDGYLHGITLDGEEAVRLRTDSSAYSSPAIADGVAYFGGLDGRFFAIRLGLKS